MSELRSSTAVFARSRALIARNLGSPARPHELGAVEISPHAKLGFSKIPSRGFRVASHRNPTAIISGAAPDSCGWTQNCPLPLVSGRVEEFVVNIIADDQQRSLFDFTSSDSFAILETFADASVGTDSLTKNTWFSGLVAEITGISFCI